MEKLPCSIKSHIFRFLSHPAADAIRNRIMEFQTFSRQFGSSDMHTFYIFFFLGGSAWASTATTSVRVCGGSTRANSRDTFRGNTSLILIGQPFVRAKEFILKYNNIYIEINGED